MPNIILDNLTINQPVANITALNSIPTAALVVGVVCWVNDPGELYTWTGTAWATNAGSLPNGSNVIYVSASGDDANSGLSLAQPKLTFGNAISTAESGYSIVCLEGGSFDEVLEISDNITIYAPACGLILSQNEPFALKISNRCRVTFASIQNTFQDAVQINTADHFTLACNSIVGNIHAINVLDANAIGVLLVEENTGPLDFIDTSMYVTIRDHSSGSVAGTTNIVGQIGDTLYGFGSGGGLPNYTNQWFVSTEIGNDQNNGRSQASPFQTIGAAVSAWDASGATGLITILDSGSYSEMITIPTSMQVLYLYGPNANILGTLTTNASLVLDIGSIDSGNGDALIINTVTQVRIKVGSLVAPLGNALDCIVSSNGTIDVAESSPNLVFNDGIFFVTIGKIQSPNVTGTANIAGYIGMDTYGWSQGGGVGDQANIIYVSATGNDSNSGLNIGQAKLTFAAAITAAQSGDGIVCLEGGSFSESLTIATDNISIFAPNVDLTSSGASTIDIQTACKITFGGINNEANAALSINTDQLFSLTAGQVIGGTEAITSPTNVGTGIFTIKHVNGNVDFNSSAYFVTINDHPNGTVSNAGQITGIIDTDFYGFNTTLPAQTNIIYVAKAGDDANSGFNITDAKLTFGGALAIATGNEAIVCLDGGIYDESLTISINVSIFAPNATLSYTGALPNYTLQLNSMCYVKFKEISNASFIGLALESADDYIVDADIVSGGGSNTAILSTTFVGIGHLSFRQINGPIEFNGSSYKVNIGSQSGGVIDHAENIVGQIGAKLYNMEVPLPYTAVGPSHEFETVGAAVSAGHTQMLVMEDTTEASPITLSSGDYFIEILDSARINMQGNDFLFGTSDQHITLKGGELSFAYGIAGTLFNANTHSSCSVSLEDITILNGSSVGSSAINDTNVEISLLRVTADLPNAASCGIDATNTNVITDLTIIGGGNACDECLINCSDTLITNLVFRGDFVTSGPIMTTSTPCVINNLLVNSAGASVDLYLGGLINNVMDPSNSTDISIYLQNANSRLSGCRLKLGIVHPVGLESITYEDVHAGSLDDTASNTDFAYITNCSFANAMSIKGDGNMITGTNFWGGLRIIGGSNSNSISGCMAGDPQNPGNTTTIEIETGSQNNIVVGSSTDDAIIDSGTGTQTAANVVF